MNISKESSLYFINCEINKKCFSVSDYNNKRNLELKSKINNSKFDEIDEIYSLLDQYKENKRDKNILKIIKSKIETNKYYIKGICYKNKESFSSLNNYTDLFLDGLKYNIQFDLYKICDKENNKLIKLDKNKYSIILLNINEEDKKYIEKNLINFPRSVLLFTNLQAILELNSFDIYTLSFKSTYKTKIYMEKNKISELDKSKKNFKSSGIYIDYLKSNEFAYINWINTQKLFSYKANRFKNEVIKGYNFEIIIDLKSYLEIETESLYLENSNNNKHYLKENMNFCCFVKNIYKSIDKKLVNVTLENLFDLNTIILEIPNGHEILENLHINCIYLFINIIIFIDEKMNIKLTLNDKITERSKIILLYFLVDSEKYNNRKIYETLSQKNFSQLISLIKDNKIIRTIKKYLVMIIKINYINIYFSNEGKEITYYEGLIQCSDGTSCASFHIRGKDISKLKKIKININHYLTNKNASDKKMTIYPNINDDLQLIIIGHPIMENIKELSFLEIYENINELKEIGNNNKKMEDLEKFDLFMTKNEFTVINGSFLKKSKFLEEIPIIKVIKFISIEEYINLIDSAKNKEDEI